MSDKHNNATIRAATAAFIGELLPHIIGPIREVARSCGYAIAIHGSLARDIDLVAVPWINEADSPDDLARAVHGAVAGVVGRCHIMSKEGRIDWTSKPHGRLATTIVLPALACIDFSVFPPTSASSK